jgi:hypothetical protein
MSTSNEISDELNQLLGIHAHPQMSLLWTDVNLSLDIHTPSADNVAFVSSDSAQQFRLREFLPGSKVTPRVKNWTGVVPVISI